MPNHALTGAVLYSVRDPHLTCEYEVPIERPGNHVQQGVLQLLNPCTALINTTVIYIWEYAAYNL